MGFSVSVSWLEPIGHDPRSVWVWMWAVGVGVYSRFGSR